MFGDNLTERFQLASDRIKEICVGSDCQQGEPWSIYFRKTAGFINNMTELACMVRDGVFSDWSVKELAEYNKSLYIDILEDNYEEEDEFAEDSLDDLEFPGDISLDEDEEGDL